MPLYTVRRNTNDSKEKLLIKPAGIFRILNKQVLLMVGSQNSPICPCDVNSANLSCYSKFVPVSIFCDMLLDYPHTSL